MEEKSNEATSRRPQGSRILDAPLVDMDLNVLSEQVRNEKTWKENDRNAITLFKSNGMRIVLIALRQGAQMDTHTADGLISLQVLEGKMSFTTEERSIEMGKGQMLALHKGVPHRIGAMEETIFLLTLTTTRKRIYTPIY